MIIRKRNNWLAAASLIAGFALAGAAQAQDPKLAGEFGDWAAYWYPTNGGKVCYIVSQPKSTLPEGANRDPIFFLVTHRPGEQVRSEVNTIIGYPFRKDSLVKLTIDATDFDLYTDGDGAWAESSVQDRKVVATMKKGAKMVVVGVSRRGTKTTDGYSLSGVTAAMDKIDELCR